MAPEVSVADVLSGLAPARGGACPRCGAGTLGFANGRGRLDLCGACGSLDVHTSEGLELLSIRGARHEVAKMRSKLEDWRLVPPRA